MWNCDGLNYWYHSFVVEVALFPIHFPKSNTTKFSLIPLAISRLCCRNGQIIGTFSSTAFYFVREWEKGYRLLNNQKFVFNVWSRDGSFFFSLSLSFYLLVSSFCLASSSCVNVCKWILVSFLSSPYSLKSDILHDWILSPLFYSLVLVGCHFISFQLIDFQQRWFPFCFGICN